MMQRWPGLDADAIRASNRKQAVIPEGATVLDPVGTAPGLVVPPLDGHGIPTVVVLPGPPASSSRCGRRLGRPRRSAPRSPARPPTAARSCACSGSPSRRSRTPCAPPRTRGWSSSRWRSPPACAAARSRSPPVTSRRAEADYEALLEFIRERHGDTLFSLDGSTIDEQVAGLLAGHTIADGRVVHRRAAGRPPDRSRRFLGLLPGWRGGVLQPGQDRSRRRRPGR